MDWKYVKPLRSEELISEFENAQGMTPSEEFKELMRNCNGGRPDKKGFDTDTEKKKCLKSFLSFN